MRNIDAALKAKLLLAQKTLYNNANLKIRAIVSRPRSAISNIDFWREVIVSPGVTATDTSVAIRRQQEGDLGDVAYVAQVVGTTLTIKRAIITILVTDMIWETVEIIENCLNCALQFDGYFVQHAGDNVEFVTDEVPYIFYTNSSNSLWYKKIGEEQSPMLGANVTSVDVIRGMKSVYGDNDDGLYIFYTIGGGLYYQQLIGGVLTEQITVSIAPANVVSVHAERTFDYRIVLQVVDGDGKLYEIFSKMEASGWGRNEHLKIVDIDLLTADLLEVAYIDYKSDDEYLQIADMTNDSWLMSVFSPVLVSAINLPIEIDYGYGYETGSSLNYGYMVEFYFDQLIKNCTDYPDDFKLVDNLGQTWSGQEAVLVGRYVYVLFADFNNAENPVKAKTVYGRLSNGYTLVDASEYEFTAENLVPTFVPQPIPVLLYDVDNWTIVIEFDRSIVNIASQAGFVITGFEPNISPAGVVSPATYVPTLIEHLPPQFIADADLSVGTYDDTRYHNESLQLGVNV